MRQGAGRKSFSQRQITSRAQSPRPRLDTKERQPRESGEQGRPQTNHGTDSSSEQVTNGRNP